MSEINVTEREPINVVIAPSDPVLAAVVQEFAATLNFLTAQVTDAVSSIGGKVDQSEIDSILTQLGAVQQVLVALDSTVQGKADSDHSQPISSITGLDDQLAQIAQQFLAIDGGGDLAVQIAALQTALADKASNAAISILDSEISVNETNIQDLATALSGKASAVHTHSVEAITGLQTQLASLQAQISAIQSAGGGSSQQLTYTSSQNTIFSNDPACDGSFAKLTDGVLTNGALTTNAANSWIMADLGSAKKIDQIDLAGGNIGGNTNFAGLLNTSVIQTSINNLDWTLLFTIQGVQNDRISSFTLTAKARYVRILRSGGLAGATEFRIWGQ